MNQERLHRYISESTRNESNICQIYVIKDGRTTGLDLYITPMTENEREIVKAGCLINFNRNRKK